MLLANRLIVMSNLKRIVAITAAALMTLSSVPFASAGTFFADVDDFSPFGSYINNLAADGIVGGVDGMYFGNANSTRAELTKFMNGAAGLDMTVAPGAPHFNDVPLTHTLYPHVEASFANGVVNGRAPGIFAPDDPVLRQETAKIVVNTMRAVDTEGFFDELTVGGPHFLDVPASSEFYGYVETLYNLGCVRGYGNGLFGPMNSTTRNEMAKVVDCGRQVLIDGPPPIPVGAPARLRVEASEDEIAADTYSSSTITTTVVDSADSVAGGYGAPVTCSTDLGVLTKTNEDDGGDIITIDADSGRATFTLVSGATEGLATVTCNTGTLDDGVVQVDFNNAAPGVNNGFGSSTVSGVGSITIDIFDDLIVNELINDAFDVEFQRIPGAMATVSVQTFDDEGDVDNQANILCTIKEGSGHLTQTFPVAPLPAVGTRSVEGNASDHGRFVFYFESLRSTTRW